jgi:hypothetical protein
MPATVPVSAIFRRSTLGPGSNIIRDDEGCAIPYVAAETILDAVITEGACAVRHGGMFDKTEQATALPGGYIYEIVSKYSSRGLPERSWVIGIRAIRHIMRLLDFIAPVKPLSGESQVPTDAELIAEWDEFANRERLARIGASLGALDSMKESGSGRERNLDNGHYEPITLPIGQSTANPPSGPNSNVFDPRIADGMYWTMYQTTVEDAYGRYKLECNGKLTRI